MQGPHPDIKRAIDLAVAGSLLVVCSPLLAVVAGLIRVTMGRPILFRQARPGYRGKLFVPYKFRTMTDSRDAFGNRLPDGERVLPLGMMLRRLSIDEMPQFLNVLRGEMSMVGPRPLLAEYLE